jgi:hypothetical protein
MCDDANDPSPTGSFAHPIPRVSAGSAAIDTNGARIVRAHLTSMVASSGRIDCDGLIFFIGFNLT